MNIRSSGRLAALLVLGAFMLSACATREAPPPVAQMARAEAAIEQAEAAGAAQHAPLGLREARQRLASARNAMEARNFAAAHQFAEQAEATARVAAAEAEAVRTEQMAEETRRGVESLRQELQQRETRS